MSYLPLDNLSGQELWLYPGILHYILLGSLNVCVRVSDIFITSQLSVVHRKAQPQTSQYNVFQHSGLAQFTLGMCHPQT